MSRPAMLAQAEALRILRACRDGRMRKTESGRYVIDGEGRPQKRVRDQLSRNGLIDLPWMIGDARLTADGRNDLEELERLEAAGS